MAKIKTKKNEKLLKIRQILKKTQKEMAQILNMTFENYNRLENGHIDMSGQTLYKLLKLMCENNIIQIKKLKDY